MSREDDEYYGNIQDIEDLIQREMQELNKMQEVVNKKRSTLNDMGVKLEVPKELEDSGLLDVLNSPTPVTKGGLAPVIPNILRSPMSKDIPKLDRISADAAAASSQRAPYRFGRPKTPDISIHAHQGGVDFMGKNKENLQAIAQKKKLEKEEREKSQTRKSANNTKYESVGSKIKESMNTKSSKALDKVSASPKPQSRQDAKPSKAAVIETHLFEEEASTVIQVPKPVNSARSLSKPKTVVETRQADLRLSAVLTSSPNGGALTQKGVKAVVPKQTSNPTPQTTAPAPAAKSPRESRSPAPGPSKPRQTSKNPTTYSSTLPQTTLHQPATPKPQTHTAAPLSQPPQPHPHQPTLNPSKPPKTQTTKDQKDQKPTFRPETMDLFSKLEEYAKYKENLDLLNRCEEESALGGVVVRDDPKYERNAEKGRKEGTRDKDKENSGVSGANRENKGANGYSAGVGKKHAEKADKAEAELAGEFLKKKISGFGRKEDKPAEGEKGYSSRVLQERSPSAKNGTRTRGNPQIDMSPMRSARDERNYSSKIYAQAGASPAQQKAPRCATPQKQYLAKSIDLKKVVEPRFKREKVELPSEPSFQPMLSRKSLMIAEKMGYNGEKLWHSKTPTKTEMAGRGDSQDHMSQDNQAKTSSPWMSRLAGAQDHPGNQQSPPALSFQPKICEKSKQIDGYKQRGQGGPRHEVLHQLGMEQNMKLQRRIRDKVKEEDEEIKAMSFQPKTVPREGESFYRSGVGIADRNEQWALRKEERIQRLKESQIKAEAEQCSFKPKLVDLFLI